MERSRGELRIEYGRDTGINYENASALKYIQWLEEKFLSLENELRNIKNLFTGGE